MAGALFKTLAGPIGIASSVASLFGGGRRSRAGAAAERAMQAARSGALKELTLSPNYRGTTQQLYEQGRRMARGERPSPLDERMAQWRRERLGEAVRSQAGAQEEGLRRRYARRAEGGGYMGAFDRQLADLQQAAGRAELEGQRQLLEAEAAQTEARRQLGADWALQAGQQERALAEARANARLAGLSYIPSTYQTEPGWAEAAGALGGGLMQYAYGPRSAAQTPVQPKVATAAVPTPAPAPAYALPAPTGTGGLTYSGLPETYQTMFAPAEPVKAQISPVIAALPPEEELGQYLEAAF